MDDPQRPPAPDPFDTKPLLEEMRKLAPPTPEKFVWANYLAMHVLSAVFGSGFLFLVFIRHAGWITDHVYPWLLVVFGCAIVVDVALFCPMLIFPKSRRTAASGLTASAYVLGVYAWFYSFIVTYETLGPAWVFVGLMFGGVGVVPLGFIGGLAHHSGSEALNVALSVAVTYAASVGGKKAAQTLPFRA